MWPTSFLFVCCTLSIVLRLLHTLQHIVFPLQAPEKQCVSVPCVCMTLPRELGSAGICNIMGNRREEWYSCSPIPLWKPRAGAVPPLPASWSHVLRGALPPQTSCLPAYITLTCAYQAIPKTDFVSCCFPLSKHCLSPPSFNKIILEDRLIVVAFPASCISRSCLWGSHKFQHLCTPSFQLCLTFIEKDNIKLPSLNRSPPLLPPGRRLPCVSVVRAAGEACTDRGWIHSQSPEVAFSSLIPSIYINTRDLPLPLSHCCSRKYSPPFFEGLVGGVALCCDR